MSPRNLRSYNFNIPLVSLHKHDQNEDNNTRHDKVDRRKPTRPQFYTKNYRPLRTARVGEIVFPREEHTNWLFNNLYKESSL